VAVAVVAGNKVMVCCFFSLCRLWFRLKEILFDCRPVLSFLCCCLSLAATARLFARVDKGSFFGATLKRRVLTAGEDGVAEVEAVVVVVDGEKRKEGENKKEEEEGVAFENFEDKAEAITETLGVAPKAAGVVDPNKGVIGVMGAAGTFLASALKVEYWSILKCRTKP
jgi:hypothetical protein